MEQLEGVLHSTAVNVAGTDVAGTDVAGTDVAGTDVAGTDDVLRRVRDMDPASRQAFLAQLDDAESKVVEQLNTTLVAARVQAAFIRWSSMPRRCCA